MQRSTSPKPDHTNGNIQLRRGQSGTPLQSTFRLLEHASRSPTISSRPTRQRRPTQRPPRRTVQKILQVQSVQRNRNQSNLDSQTHNVGQNTIHHFHKTTHNPQRISIKPQRLFSSSELAHETSKGNQSHQNRRRRNIRKIFHRRLRFSNSRKVRINSDSDHLVDSQLIRKAN